MSTRGLMAGRTVLVTGGTGGIGKATALGLASMGTHLAITGRDRERTQRAALEIQVATGGQVDVFFADLSVQSEVRRLADEVLQGLPRIDVLVNNVGGYWNTRHLTADGLADHLRTQPHRTVSAHSSRPCPQRDRSAVCPPCWRHPGEQRLALNQSSREACSRYRSSSSEIRARSSGRSLMVPLSPTSSGW